ncbi:MAG: hypothetical protein IPO88_08115 [Nannocystis sp.]|uniref:hypothetical protein n=1 Tax=Nannocystis sp. TaxID=1962667 RepID=UPI00242524F8|nr:hypothetical protein [Nannocystis sp.]MBK9753456.1 hypothetical protein [Nannocystis sp.]
MAEVEEIASTLENLRGRMVELVVRGLASVAPGDLSPLELLTDSYERQGLVHITSRLRAMLRAITSDTRGAPVALLSAYTSLHVFERVLSLEAAASAWAQAIAAGDEDEDEAEAVAASPGAVNTELTSLPAPEQKKLAALLEELARAIEDLVRTGLTSATEATRQKLDVSFKEASRMKLLRLGATLRYVNEEVGRFLAHSEAFSAKRFVFFTHRAWLLARGLAEALAAKNDRVLARLSGTGARDPLPVRSIDVVTLGVFARTVQNTCTFEFRLRVVKAEDPALVGRSLVFGLVFGRKSADITAEAFLHLPQPQKYHPKIFSERMVLTVTGAAIALDERGGGRLLLGPKGTVTQQGKLAGGWEPYLEWQMGPALARARALVPSPLDLPNELQEEVVLADWSCKEDRARATPERRIFAVTAAGLELDAVVSTGADGKTLAGHLEAHAKRKPSAAKPPAPLYGLVHYELGRLVLTPLATLGPDGPLHLMLSNEKINLSALLGSLQL